MMADIMKRALHPSRILEGQMRGFDKLLKVYELNNKRSE